MNLTLSKKTLYSLLAVAFLALTAFIFFFPDDIEGNVLQQHDIQQGIANGQEGKAFNEATGETTRWTNSLFGGMPNFQIAPSYPAGKAIGWIWNVYTLWLPSPANLLFAMMLGFFIMCLCLRFKWYNALFASLAWGFSSYFIIIIGAGHIWKFEHSQTYPPLSVASHYATDGNTWQALHWQLCSEHCSFRATIRRCHIISCL